MKTERRIFQNVYLDSVTLMRISANLMKLEGVAEASVLMGDSAPTSIFWSKAVCWQNRPWSNPVIWLSSSREMKECWTMPLPKLPKPCVRKKAVREKSASFRRLLRCAVPWPKTPTPLSRSYPYPCLCRCRGSQSHRGRTQCDDLFRQRPRVAGSGPQACRHSSGSAGYGTRLRYVHHQWGSSCLCQCRSGVRGVGRCGGMLGTGIQQVTCLIHGLGQGISQAIGTGGHDLSAEVGGLTMLAGIDALARDDSTKIITLISKPPSREVGTTILKAAAATGKPVVVNFFGADPAALIATLDASACSRFCIANDCEEPPTVAWLLPKARLRPLPASFPVRTPRQKLSCAPGPRLALKLSHPAANPPARPLYWWNLLL